MVNGIWDSIAGVLEWLAKEAEIYHWHYNSFEFVGLFFELENVIIKTMFGNNNLIKVRTLDIKKEELSDNLNQWEKMSPERAKDITN